MRKYLILVAMLAIALTGCRVESIVSLDIEADGSALVGAEVGFDEEFQQLLGDAGADPTELFGDLPDFGGEDVTTTERTDGEMTYYGVTTTVDDLSAFDTAGPAGDVFSSFSYTFDDETAQLQATVTADTIGEAGGDLPIDPSEITDDFFSASVVVMMPGAVTSSNADEVRSDGALVWDLPITGGDVVIEATSDIGGGGTSNLLIIVIALILGLSIIAIVVATIMNRRRSEQAVAAATTAHETARTAELDVAGTDLDPSNDDADVAGGTDDEATLVDVELEYDEDQPDNT